MKTLLIPNARTLQEFIENARRVYREAHKVRRNRTKTGNENRPGRKYRVSA